ncbi:hypothetical protein K3G39_19865 [Pontibacter sp. HSC-14F20]|uniref:phage/plasmid replication domain-containing protein n=1 Tax=Pontibacter sp. HSC-14F20 TaxID=2864136 RepID=UPI001C736EB2|nr:phage/plasmid replication protein [Pontibacter sp. HSC-14F20]MBX0335497.1 hypothetical protein [Pontibacter sp. HSC-14F20]
MVFPYSKQYRFILFINAMYCTIGQFLAVDMIGGSVWDCLPYLTNLSENYRQDTGKTYITGNAGNLRIGISEHGVSIKGSLAKFYLGTNLHTLTRSDSKRAFELMADTLHLPVYKAKVTRIDVGQNIMTDYKPELYYPYLGQSAYYTKLTQPKSISYQNSQRSKKAYNKIAESKKNRVTIPEVYAGKHLLRFEVSYTARLPKQFNQALITPDTLTDERFYIAMYDRWHNEYESINKVGLTLMDTSKINTPKDYKDQLLRLVVQERGLEAFLHHIEVMKEQKVFKHKKYYTDLKNDLKKMVKSQSIAEQPELIQELDKKIANAKRYYR